MRKPIAASLVALFAAATLSSCGAADLARSDVEARIVSKLGVKSASCPGDLKSEEGTTMTCSTITADDQQQDVELEVTKVDGNNVSFDITPIES
jgi:hypothetical protein